MELAELRKPEEARKFILQGLWLQRVVLPTPANTAPTLAWALALAANGSPLPPIGFLADVGHLALDTGRGKVNQDFPVISGFPAGFFRTYEDYVLGKIHSDWNFERATTALMRFQAEERNRGLAYIVMQIQERGQVGGVELSPAVIRGMQSQPVSELLQQGYDSLTTEGPMPLFELLYRELIAAFRKFADVLGSEDVLALEQRTAIAELGQYVAHRQILQTASRLEAGLPTRPQRAESLRNDVATRILDEDQYPVGGYSSLSNRGSLESLLHSQLAFMEEETPDLFDVKFVRDELFYYSRDENNFHRRRKAFVLVLNPDLAAARFKDAELPCQRIILVLSLIVVVVRRLSEWLTTDALRFEVLFLAADGRFPLVHESELLQLILQDARDRGTLVFGEVESPAALATRLTGLSQMYHSQALVCSCQPLSIEAAGVRVDNMVVNGPRPVLTETTDEEGDDAFDVWQAACRGVLERWV